MARTILAVVPDLFFATRIREVAAASGASVRESTSAEAGVLASETGAALAIVDLHGVADAAATVRALRAAAPGMRIVGFHSHVDTAVRDAALAAGADQVLPRSAFTRRLAEMLAGA